MFNFLLVRICRTKILLEFFSGSQAIDKRIFFDELNDYLKFIRDLLPQLLSHILLYRLEIGRILHFLSQVHIFSCQLFDAAFEQGNLLLVIAYFGFKVLDSLIVLFLELDPAVAAVKTGFIFRAMFFRLNGIARVQFFRYFVGLKCGSASCFHILGFFMVAHWNREDK